MAVTRIWDADNNTWQFVGAGPIAPSQGYLPGNPIYYTASGSFVKASFPGMVALLVECQGAGGAGGGAPATAAGQKTAGAGGNGGNYARKIVPVSDLDTTEAVTVPAGATGVSAAQGNHAADAIFDTISGEVRGSGGYGGQSTGEMGDWLVGGSPFQPVLLASAGDLVILGKPGQPGRRDHLAGGNVTGGHGGASFLSSEVLGNSNAVANNGTLYGGGGAGAANTPSQGARAGGNGAQGIVIVTPLYSTDGAGGTGPRGFLAVVGAPAHAGIGTTEVDVTGATVTVTVPASRRLMIRYQTVFYAATTAGLRRFFIYEGGAQLGVALFHAAAAGSFNTLTLTALVTPTAGSHTYKIRASADIGTTNIETGYGGYLMVEDIGAA
jgi:hypothetical protein